MSDCIILNISEQNPNEIDARLNRTGQLAIELANSGYKVTWITSSFSHQKKRYLEKAEKQNLPNINFFFLKSLPYRKNISLIRVLNNFVLAMQAAFLLFFLKRPLMIYCYTPPIELAFISALSSRLSNAPFILDVRDNWPDSFEHLFPEVLKPSTKFLFYPWRLMLYYTLGHSNKILASSKEQAKFAKKYIKDTSKIIKIFYIGDDVPEINFEERNCDSIQLLFIGTLTNARPLFTTIENLNKLKNKINLTVIGDGENLHLYKNLAKSNERITFLGRKTGKDLISYVKKSDILIAPYEEAGYGWSMPSKISSYIGFGRPIITNIGHETKEFLDNYNLGSVIDFGDIDQFNNAIHKWAKVDRKKHFKQARKVYEKNFDMKKIAKSMSKYIFDG